MAIKGKLGTIALSATSASAPALSSPGTFNVTVTGVRQWLAQPNVAWITITAPIGLQESSAAVDYTVATNSIGAPARVGTISVAGRIFTVSQAAGALE